MREKSNFQIITARENIPHSLVPSSSPRSPLRHPYRGHPCSSQNWRPTWGRHPARRQTCRGFLRAPAYSLCARQPQRPSSSPTNPRSRPLTIDRARPTGHRFSRLRGKRRSLKALPATHLVTVRAAAARHLYALLLPPLRLHRPLRKARAEIPFRHASPRAAIGGRSSAGRGFPASRAFRALLGGQGWLLLYFRLRRVCDVSARTSSPILSRKPVERPLGGL